MTVHPDIPTDVTEVQIAASDPRASAWVSANAGSGKTYVLAQRVIRLLLDGAKPSKMLCLTFTKAAAANMANRVFGTLAQWTSLDDATLDAALTRMEGRPPSPQRRLRARRLFAEALETPGGLKVQTIHAFCTGLLHQFPFEADVAARFEVLESRAEAELIDSLRMQVMLEATDAPDSALGRALALAIPAAADQTFADVVREAIGMRDAIQGWLARVGGLDAAAAELSRAVGAAPDDTVEGIEAEFLAGPHLPASEWGAVSAAFATGSANDLKQSKNFTLAGSEKPPANIEAYLRIFCNADQSRRKSVATKAIQNAHPDLFARLIAEQDRVCELLDRRRAIAARDRTMALVTIADAVIRRYRAAKDARGLLDYDDLIDKTLSLMRNVDAAWVHYKLDLGIDHVLIDEAQDTSPKQWSVIRGLVAEFFAGAGARGTTPRSIFAVGDEKQSIYSFQGAAPHRFDEMRRHFEGQHRDSELPFAPLAFKYSFRSGPNVLGAVDSVFARPEAYRGLSTDAVQPVHAAVRRTAPGHVEVWALNAPLPQPEIIAWEQPLDAVSETSPRVQLARRIASAVKGWIDSGERLSLTGRATTPGDVLVLVRQRGELFEAIIRALKEAGVEVAGADRLVLNAHIAVMDLMSLADALLLERDDLALAEVLKSPLFGFDDDRDLFPLAWDRKGASLRASLRARAAENPRWAAASATLDRWAHAARHETPFGFYARLLGAEGGRRKMLARLGHEAADALDEFLALALDYERREAPSLQGFVAWMRAAPTEIKRDMDIGRNEVRVMTVHGAKGLEAPIVILADTVTRPTGPRDPRLLVLDGAGLPPDSAPPIVWAGRKDDDVPVAAAAREAARQAAEEEHRRLLYVAMTRAADRLIVCGARGRTEPPAGCWYDLVHGALVASEAAPTVEEIGSDETRMWRWRKSDFGAVPDTAADDTPTPVAAVEPAWLRQIATTPEGGATLLTPSDALERRVARSAVRRGDQPDIRAALLRGQRVHRLLQALPDVAPERREEAARRYLSRQPQPPDEAEASRLVGSVLDVLSDPDFAPLFAPGTRAEVPIVGRLTARGRPVSVSGQIDRLVVTADAVLVADYKTDPRPPASLAAVDAGYVTQLALYRAVLMRLYPDRPVRAALVWTEIPRLMELPATALDAAAAHLGVTPP